MSLRAYVPAPRKALVGSVKAALARPLGSLFCGGWDSQRRCLDSSMQQQQQQSFASYTGRGKPTRTRVREQKPEQYGDSPAGARQVQPARLEESAVQEEHNVRTRAVDSFGDAGLKQFMVNVCK